MKSKAAVLVGDRTFEMRELPVPDQPQPGGAILKVEGCGICGSDVKQYEGVNARLMGMPFPVIPGHEILGRIFKIAPEDGKRLGLREGDRVAVTGVAPCGVCEPCRLGRKCADHFYYGFRSLSLGGSGLYGGYSQYVEIAPRTRLTPVNPDLSIQDALLFNPFAAGFDWVIRVGETKVGERVLITGGGQRGLACVIAAKEAGASQIIITGLTRDAYKLDIAKQFGATHAINVEETDLREEVRAITGGLGVDKVIETTPLAFRPILDAIELVRPGGTIVLAGHKGGYGMPDFPIDAVALKQIRIIGALSTSEWAVQMSIKAIDSGRYPVHLMHTHTVDLEGAEHALHMLAGEIEGESPLHISIVPN